MLVKVRHGAELSGAEKEFVDCLRSFPITCFAAIDLHVGGNGTRRIDAVLLTPHGITVVAVKGFRRRQSGILNITDSAAWTISDAPADLDDTSTAAPSDQLEQSVYAVRNAVERALLDPGHVCGVVVLIPFRGVVVRPARTNLRPGLDVVVANVPDATDLRIYIEGFSAAARDWTADRVVAAVHALGLENGPSRAELIADGFAANAPSARAAVLPELRPKPKPVPKPSSRPQAVGAWAVVAVAVVGVLAVFGVVVTAWVKDSTGPESVVEPTSTVAPSPAPRTPKDCWPFQSDC
ncbi:nuclease-related domain-containing protein [Nocardia sp. NPDC005366]|uniref:nuclease-related domain-containing protein n=1 Tax=Nocardia sp. NPDC005366 TaxID=3156878 RepID=UPI0033A6FD65